jgi:Protein of unknown function (DUF3175)
MEKSASKSRLWSAEVTKRSNALDLEPGVFTWKDEGCSAPHTIRHSDPEP